MTETGSPPKFLQQVDIAGTGRLDMYQLELFGQRTLVGVPVLEDGWPAELKNAVERRRRARLPGLYPRGLIARPPAIDLD